MEGQAYKSGAPGCLLNGNHLSGFYLHTFCDLDGNENLMEFCS